MQSLLVMSLALFAVASAAPSPEPTISQASQCSGCQGSGLTDGLNSAPGCGSVEVEITVESGHCAYVGIYGQSGFQCTGVTACTVAISRRYTGIPAGAIVTGCVSQGGQRYCIDPPLSSNGGSGTPDAVSYTLECGSGQFTWSTVAQCASAPGGRIAAQASGNCSSCPG